MSLLVQTFSIWVYPICRNFDDLQTLLARINVKFNVIGITETRLNKSSIRNTNIDLSGYSFPHTPTEANCRGALFYIDNNINYIVRVDLCVYRNKELESVFNGYFNMDLFKYDHNADSASFLGSLYSSFLLLYISARTIPSDNTF